MILFHILSAGMDPFSRLDSLNLLFINKNRLKSPLTTTLYDSPLTHTIYHMLTIKMQKKRVEAIFNIKINVSNAQMQKGANSR